MLRITKVVESLTQVTLKLEGRIVSDWVSLLERECQTLLHEKQRVRLDFSEVTFIDGRGVEMLKRIAAENLQILNCSAFIEDLFKGGRESWDEEGEQPSPQHP